MNLGILVALICSLFAVVRAQKSANGGKAITNIYKNNLYRAITTNLYTLLIDCYNSLSCSGGRICFQGKCESRNCK